MKLTKWAFALVLALVLCMAGSVAMAEVTLTGSGTQADPYLVDSVEEMNAALIKSGESVYIKLTASFSVTGEFSQITAENVTIDFAGCTITATDPKTTNYQLFHLNSQSGNPAKTMTVLDSVGNGGVTLSAENNNGWGRMSNIFEVKGTVLTIKGGNYIHNGGTDMSFVVNVNSNSADDTTLNVENGTLKSSYIGVRCFMDKHGKTSVHVTGGSVIGNSRALWAQAPNSTPGQTAELTVNGGTVSNANGGTAIDIARTSASSVELNVKSGVVNGSIKAEEQEVSISGGTVTGTLIMLDESGAEVTSGDCVTGGTFTNDPSAYVKDTVVAAQVEQGSASAYAIGAAAVEKAIASGATTVTILQGNADITVSEGTTVNNKGNGTVTANGQDVAKDETVEFKEIIVTYPTTTKPYEHDHHFVKGSSKGFGFRALNAFFDKNKNGAHIFKDNGEVAEYIETLTAKNPPAGVTFKDGSIEVQLGSEYLNTLEAGEYTIWIVEDVNAEYTRAVAATFTVADPYYVPRTGDNSNVLLWAGLMLVSTLAMVSLTKKRVTDR